MSLANYKKHVREKKFHFVQHGGNGRKALIMYECLPDKLRKQLDEREPKARERFIKQQSFPMNIRLKSDDKAVEFYKTYIPKISIERQKEYVLNAKVMNAMMAQETGLRNKHSEHGYTQKTGAQYCHFLMRGASQVLQPYTSEERVPSDGKVRGLQKTELRGVGQRYYR